SGPGRAGGPAGSTPVPAIFPATTPEPTSGSDRPATWTPSRSFGRTETGRLFRDPRLTGSSVWKKAGVINRRKRSPMSTPGTDAPVDNVRLPRRRHRRLWTIAVIGVIGLALGVGVYFWLRGKPPMSPPQVDLAGADPAVVDAIEDARSAVE